MESETSRTLRRHKQEEDTWRRRCGCLRTSEKLKQILDSFPPPPPPPPTPEQVEKKSITPLGNNCISAYCTHVHQSCPSNNMGKLCEELSEVRYEEQSSKVNRRSWRIVSELVQLLQLSVTATALALYYLIYCYMQLIYYTLRSALYFHNADGAMKITIGIVTITSIFVAFNLIIRLERLIGVF
ncbi:uncharacterized protein LOC126769710 [Nymphalis io]|uniref:uncharacterized protein LOC126769710 n=1 Tax=Inachis io TaxID=171585 RepID=UPI002169234B|nr:uncharacterized protein LOC126769710 [Nymphalis io]XP_050344586.1 uncharacterized protein LOC126769710 [Nymphalis io]